MAVSPRLTPAIMQIGAAFSRLAINHELLLDQLMTRLRASVGPVGHNAGVGTGGEVRVSDAYTVFWTMDRWLSAVAVGHRPLPVLFGGPHLSEPSFRKAGVRVGDTVYPVTVVQPPGAPGGPDAGARDGAAGAGGRARR